MQQDSRTGRKDIAAAFGYSQATPLLPVPSFWLHLLGSCPQPQRRVGCAPCHSPWPPKDAAPPLTVHLEVGVCPLHCRAVGKPTGHPQPSGKKVNFMGLSGAIELFCQQPMAQACFLSALDRIPCLREKRGKLSTAWHWECTSFPMESYKQKADFTECHLEN